MILEIKNFSKIYNKIPVIEDMSITVTEPLVVGLIGDNGAGKTTLLKCIAGFIRDYQGIIKTSGMITSSIEAPAFFENLTVKQNLILMRKLIKNQQDISIEAALDYVGLIDHVNKKFKDLSLGMKQKLSVARMMVSNSDVYLLDEPFNSLDIKTKKELQVILKKLKSQGKTLIVSSHILEELSELCDVVWYLKNGKLIDTINLHAKVRKYNIVIKPIELKILQEIEGITILKQSQKTFLLRTHLPQERIFEYLQHLIDLKIEIIEYYDVTHKLDDYMREADQEGEGYGNL